MEQIANFERIEALVRQGKIGSMAANEVKALRSSLLTDTPLSDNPKFQQRVQRVEAALVDRLASEKSWWEKPAGILLLAVIGSVVAAGIIFRLGWL